MTIKINGRISVWLESLSTSSIYVTADTIFLSIRFFQNNETKYESQAMRHA